MKIIHQGFVPDPPVIKYFGTCTNCGTIVECEDDEITISSEKRPGGTKTYSIFCPTENCGYNIMLQEGTYNQQRLSPVSNLFGIFDSLQR